MTKNLILAVFLFGMVAAVYSVGKIQDMRSGAAINIISSQIIPDQVTIGENKIFDLYLWINSGSTQNKVSGAELNVNYDSSKLILVGTESQEGFEIVNGDGGLDQNGNLSLKLITMREEKGGSMKIVKLRFKTLGKGNGWVEVRDGKLMVTGQSATWDILTLGKSSVVISGELTGGEVRPTSSGCVPRPRCLDMVPGCKLVEPAKGWCQGN